MNYVHSTISCHHVFLQDLRLEYSQTQHVNLEASEERKKEDEEDEEDEDEEDEEAESDDHMGRENQDHKESQNDQKNRKTQKEESTVNVRLGDGADGNDSQTVDDGEGVGKKHSIRESCTIPRTFRALCSSKRHTLTLFLWCSDWFGEANSNEQIDEYRGRGTARASQVCEV
eukprot:SAG11_NODE_816_length_7030_cov_15.673784_3_plen_172_part_00